MTIESPAIDEKEVGPAGELGELQAWLTSECERRHLTWREASIGSGSNPGAISSIMTGVRPGLQICVNLAQYFDVSPEFVLRLAGHLEPKDTGALAPLAEQKIGQIMNLLPKLDLQTQADLTEAMLSIAMVIVQARGDDHGGP